MVHKNNLKFGMIIQDSDEKYGMIIEKHGEKFIAYNNVFQPLACFDDDLVSKDISIECIYEIDDYIILNELLDIQKLDERDKLVCIWSRD